MENKYISSTNHEQLPCVIGPGNGLGYYAHNLNPELTCQSISEAVRAALIANIAYKAGFERAQMEMRFSLGIIK